MNDQRRELVENLEKSGYITTSKVKEAMLKVPREEFLPDNKRSYAYLDSPLPIGKGQTISAPHMVAIICEKLDLKEGMRVLEIGTGFGYNAAVVAEIVGPSGYVYTLERIESLAEKARENLKRTGYKEQVKVVVGDGTRGYSDEAPFDRIYATASAPKIPAPLKDQMKVGGILLSPVGTDHYFQELILIRKISENDFETQNLGGVAFVPMIGKHGWPE
ncbi:MAG TPA: protein-L-isoaspartate O-methyltransferase [Methanobacteriaceae archaeon]|nr:protein-L-isoaspartate O-methyltransferase [Methanobacteriaceae archaeon]